MKQMLATGKSLANMKTDLPTVLSSMLEELPGVFVGKKFNSTNFTVRKKMFAFTRDGGGVLKLPPETVRAQCKPEQQPCSSWESAR